MVQRRKLNPVRHVRLFITFLTGRTRKGTLQRARRKRGHNLDKISEMYEGEEIRSGKCQIEKRKRMLCFLNKSRGLVKKFWKPYLSVKPA